jgi:predicted Ser/Thr protein kinase
VSELKICPTCGTEYPANARFCDRDGTALRSQGGGTDLVGSIIAERYHVLKKLGEGGMGQVYLAEHVKMGRKSAVKVMNPGMVNDADAISRFNREAANASRINHPNVAGIYDFGETPEGLIYLAMEFIEGESLTSLVEKNGALPPMRAADITKQAADGLQVAHEMGIVHRDLKPDNIMIAKNRDGSDCVKVVDFGIAKAAGAENQKVTKTGLVVGTPEYMSPEQLAGDKLDGKSDIYSLALVAYNMLTGKLPFEGETAQESMIMRLTDDPRPLSMTKPDTSWPAEVQDVMARALQRKREDRYDSASKFGIALYQAVEHMPRAAAAGATQMIGAMDGATAVIAPPPKTRLDASAAASPGASQAAGAPVRSKMPVYAGAGVVALALAAAAFVYLPKSANKSGATPPASSGAAVQSETRVTAPPEVTQQNVAAPKSGGQTGGTKSVERPSTPLALGTKASVANEPAAPGSVSYGRDLAAIDASVNDGPTGKAALEKLHDMDTKVTLPADKAAWAFIEAKATTYVVGAEKGCRMMQLVRRNDLPTGMKADFDDGLKECK